MSIKTFAWTSGVFPHAAIAIVHEICMHHWAVIAAFVGILPSRKHALHLQQTSGGDTWEIWDKVGNLSQTLVPDLSDTLWRAFWIFKIFLKYLSNYFPNETPHGEGGGIFWILVDLRFARLFSELLDAFSEILVLSGSADRQKAGRIARS